jgi:hypothetical protein
MNKGSVAPKMIVSVLVVATLFTLLTDESWLIWIPVLLAILTVSGIAQKLEP